MYDLYFRNFNKKVALTGAEEAEIREYLSFKKLRKKQYLLQEGDVCKSFAFVEKGVLRAYKIDENGNEHIIQFAVEGWFISDMHSFLSGVPSIYNIDAIEDSELVIISKAADAELLKKCPKYETLGRLNITGAYLAMQKRIISLLSDKPDERYKDFISIYPDIAMRVPQHMIASYMGLTPETLSRVRRRLSESR